MIEDRMLVPHAAQSGFQPVKMKQSTKRERATGFSRLALPIRGRGIFTSLNPWVLCFYLLVSIMFCGFYFQKTSAWPTDVLRAYTYSSSHYPGDAALFRFRVLMPLLARSLAYIVRADLRLIYYGLATLSVFGLLIVYRSYLSNFLRPEFSTVLCVGLIYPMLWNYCLLNNLYFPFDLPSIFFFTLGCHYIYQRKWRLYYPVFVLAVLNRETSFFLVFVVLFCLFKKMKSRRLLWHLIAQVSIWVGLKSLLYSVLGGDPRVFSLCHLSWNTKVISGILTFGGNGPKDLAKLVLAFGGTWLAIPWLLRNQPQFLRRCILAVIPCLIVISLMGIIDEMRLYAELIPIVFSPVIYAVARELGGSKEGGTVPRAKGDRSDSNSP